MTHLRSRFPCFLIFALALFNIGIFARANAVPNRTIHNEIIGHHFFWSQTDVDELTLRSGLHARDLFKPLVWKQVDGIFRTRQVSYLAEMLSFKFEQRFIQDPTKAYTLVAIHVLNVALLSWLVLRLSGSGGALAAGLLLLNSGTCLNTLNFSFRNAKLLAMTFCLIAGLILIRHEEERQELGARRLAAYAFVALLALLTDEISLFILPLFWLTLVARRGLRGLLDVRFLLTHLSVCFMFLVGLFVLYVSYISRFPSPSHFYPGLQIRAMQEVKRLLLYEPVVAENIRAFFMYFFPRNFGQWQTAGWGLMGALAMCTFLVLGMARHRPFLRPMVFPALTLGVMASVALFLPHNGGVHKVLMPENARVPSLLYFSYYYTYPFSVLACLLLGTASAKGLSKQWKGALGIFLVTVVNLSNTQQASAGPPADALEFHGWTSEKQDAMMRIRFLRSLDTPHPVYLSFPSGPDPLVDCNWSHRPIQNLYACVIPVTYPRQFEKGFWRMSLRNIYQVPWVEDLDGSDFFYDVATSVRLNMREIRFLRLGRWPTTGSEADDGVRYRMDLGVSRATKIYLFLRGECSFTLRGDAGEFSGRQTYGYSYQVFEWPLSSLASAHSPQLQLRIDTVEAGGTVSALAAVE